MAIKWWWLLYVIAASILRWSLCLWRPGLCTCDAPVLSVCVCVCVCMSVQALCLMLGMPLMHGYLCVCDVGQAYGWWTSKASQMPKSAHVQCHVCLSVYLLGMSVLCGIKKICGPYKHKICGGNMRKSLSYIFYGVSLASLSCLWRWPPPTALALTMLLAGSWAEIFLLLAMFISIQRYAQSW